VPKKLVKSVMLRGFNQRLRLAFIVESLRTFQSNQSEHSFFHYIFVNPACPSAAAAGSGERDLALKNPLAIMMMALQKIHKAQSWFKQMAKAVGLPCAH
jgi:hypothetical protein